LTPLKLSIYIYIYIFIIVLLCQLSICHRLYFDDESVTTLVHAFVANRIDDYCRSTGQLAKGNNI